MYRVIHSTAGRLRFHVPQTQEPEYASRLQQLIESQHFVTSVRINAAARSVVVKYDMDAVSIETAQAAVIAAIKQAQTEDLAIAPTLNFKPHSELANRSNADSKVAVRQANGANRSACLIFNPVAGQSDPEEDLQKIRSILKVELDLDVRTTTPEFDADQLAKQAIDQQFEVIIASGGDGTVSAVAAAVVETDIPLGIIPRGTANAFATSLEIPTSIEQACATILTGNKRVVDAAYCDGRPMVLLAGIGFEAETVKRADREFKNKFGVLAYVLAGLQELSDLETFTAKLETEDKIISVTSAAVTVANIAPPTSVLAQGPGEIVCDDGLLDVTIVAPGDTLGAIGAAYTLLQSAVQGESVQRPDTGYLRTQSIKITTDPPQKVVLDGEVIGNTPVEIDCVPGGLTVFAPIAPEPDSPTEKLEGLPDLVIEPKPVEATSSQ